VRISHFRIASTLGYGSTAYYQREPAAISLQITRLSTYGHSSQYSHEIKRGAIPSLISRLHSFVLNNARDDFAAYLKPGDDHLIPSISQLPVRKHSSFLIFMAARILGSERSILQEWQAG
jgi:hypothetical protein